MARKLADFRKTLIQELRDFNVEDKLAAQQLSTASDFTATDGAKFKAGQYVLIESEWERVESVAANVVTVTREVKETTAVTHAAATKVYIERVWGTEELNRYLNQAKDRLYPYFYKDVVDESLALASNGGEYTIPALFVYGLSDIVDVEVKETGDSVFRPVRHFKQIGSKMRVPNYTGGTLRLIGTCGFAELAGTNDAEWPSGADDIVVLSAKTLALNGLIADRLNDKEAGEEGVGNLVGAVNALDLTVRRELSRRRMRYPGKVLKR